eukprot:COSAG06_NODE_5439_length_3481_cov_6.214666_6_plen_77_part_00
MFFPRTAKYRGGLLAAVIIIIVLLLRCCSMTRTRSSATCSEERMNVTNRSKYRGKLKDPDDIYIYASEQVVEVRTS